MDFGKKTARRDIKRNQRAVFSEMCQKRVDVAQKMTPKMPQRRSVIRVILRLGWFLTGSGGEEKQEEEAREDNLRKSAFRALTSRVFEHAKTLANNRKWVSCVDVAQKMTFDFPNFGKKLVSCVDVAQKWTPRNLLDI